MFTDHDFTRMAARLAHALGPLAVGTFGSHAMGTARDTSRCAMGLLNTGLNSSSGEAALTLSPDPNGILTPTLTKQVYLVLGYHFAYSP